MSNEIDITVRGHLGHDPAVIQNPGRQPFLRVNIASTPRIRSAEGEWSNGPTQWFGVKLFGDFALNAASSVRKGDAVIVRGRLEREEYETKDGERRWASVIVANAFGPDLRTARAFISKANPGSAPLINEAGSQASGSDVGADGEPGADGAGFGGGAADTHRPSSADDSGFEDFPLDEDAAETGLGEGEAQVA